MLQQFLLQGWTEIAVIVVTLVIALFVLWIIVSIPVWVAAKLLTLGKARFSRAMLVTAVGPIVYGIVFFISATVLAATLTDSMLPAIIGFIIAFIAWIGVFKKGFDTGWIRALGIAILAIIISAVIGIIINLVIQTIVPGAPPITSIPPLQQA